MEPKKAEPKVDRQPRRAAPSDKKIVITITVPHGVVLQIGTDEGERERALIVELGEH